MSEGLVFAPVQKKEEKVVGLVIDSIKNALVSGQLQPGDRLPSVAELSRSMNVGVSSVREAIKVLEGLCVVESRQGKGTYICTDLKEDSFNALTFQMLVLPRSTDSLLGFRKMFETAYTFMAMETATEEDLDELEAIVTALEEKTKTRPVEKQDEMDFHLGVLKCTHNLYVMRVGETMLELFLSTIQKQPIRSEKYNVPADHRRMYQAIRSKDRDSLQRELELSFCGWTDQYLRE